MPYTLQRRLAQLRSTHTHEESPVLRLTLECADGTTQRMTLHSTRPLQTNLEDGRAIKHIKALAQLSGARITSVQQLTTVSAELRARAERPAHHVSLRG